METIGNRLDRHKGVAPGFDFLRIFLAISIVAWHTDAIVTGDLSYNKLPFTWMFGYFTMAGFFSLSGFLVAASAQRLRLADFIINRAARIVPALTVEVIFCALFLGALFTTLSLDNYYSSPATWRYFTNIIGLINFNLPGVFSGHPSNIVNNTLWTVPHELINYGACFGIITLLSRTRLLVRPWPLVALILFHVTVGFSLQAMHIDPASGKANKILHMIFVGRASRLYVCFWFGIILFLLKDRVPYSRVYVAICVLISLVVGAFPQPEGTNYVLANLLVAGPLSYLTIFLGMTNIRLPQIFRRGDYSYGIYLYGWPMQQMLVAVLPNEKSLLVQFVLVIPLIMLFAAFSWHCIERPILKLRKRFSFVAKIRLEQDDQTSQAATGSANPTAAASAAAR